jgi:hypothetical protein
VLDLSPAVEPLPCPVVLEQKLINSPYGLKQTDMYLSIHADDILGLSTHQQLIDDLHAHLKAQHDEPSEGDSSPDRGINIVRDRITGTIIPVSLSPPARTSRPWAWTLTPPTTCAARHSSATSERLHRRSPARSTTLTLLSWA